MIAKRVIRKQDSSFRRLATYIFRDFQEDAPEYSRCTNCQSDDPLLSIKEVEAVQASNTRSKNDKTYHLVVSFRSGESPSHEQLEDIEDEICSSLGLGAHQRLSVLHADTDNLHLHLALNKIHPVSLRAVEPYYDKYRLDEACARLEKRHGLEQDNRIVRERAEEHNPVRGRAADMEAHSGRESFKSWVLGAPKTACEKALEGAGSWADLHSVFARYDIELRPRGAGFVVSARNVKAFTKASDLGRGFSRNNLEKKFGAFQPPGPSLENVKIVQRYTRPPLQAHAESSSLWELYQKQRHERIAQRKERFAALKLQRGKVIQRQRTYYAQRREMIRKDRFWGRYKKRELYKDLSHERRMEAQKAYYHHKAAMQQVTRTRSLPTWQDWLIDRASEGNEEALTLLRARMRRLIKGAERFVLRGEDDKPVVFPDLKPDVQKNGDVLYNFEGSYIRDTGKSVCMNIHTKPCLRTGLDMAMKKYGERLKVEGDEGFKKAVVDMVVREGLSVKFSDKAMEERRKTLEKILPLQEQKLRGVSKGRDEPLSR